MDDPRTTDYLKGKVCIVPVALALVLTGQALAAAEKYSLPSLITVPAASAHPPLNGNTASAFTADLKPPDAACETETVVTAALDTGARAKGRFIGQTLTAKGAESVYSQHEACFISVDSARQALNQGQTSFIDVRRADQFEAYRIPGALNIPAYAIKTKSFLRSRRLVLVDAGHGDASLLRTCKQLRAAGFSGVSILHGGLTAWLQHGGPIQGGQYAHAELRAISPARFHKEKWHDWVIVNFGPSPVGKLSERFDDVPVIAGEGDSRRLKRKLRTVLAGKDKRYPPAVLLVSDNGQHYQKYEKAVRQAGAKNIVQLEGGLQAYETFVAQQRAMWRHLASKPEVVTSCSIR